jgi:DNA-directed RNA polymerase subunit beta
MIEVQLESYKYFLDHLLNQAFVDAFPIDDFSGEKVSIYYKSLSIEEPKYSISECKRKNLNYEAPFKAKFEMLNKVSGEIKEQEVYMGGVPLMTEQGTFIVNGVERVIVNQIIRSNGIFMVNDAKTVGSFAMKIIPAKGSWFEIEIEKKGAIMVKVDKKRKIPVTVLLRAHGLESDAEIIQAFSGNPEFLSKHIGPTIEKDKTKSRLEALYALYKLIRPGDLGTDERVEQLFATTFFDIKKFDLGEVARMKIKRKFGVDIAYEGDGRFLQLADLVEGLKYLMSLQFRLPGFSVDDIDHLENRRVRSVGELVSDRIKVGITRLEKIAKDRMTILELDDATPGTFINARPVTAVLKEFFGTSQLSQFMDQSNPLSELANKRRLTALGNGGLTRERAGFEVRDIHPTQYGRICPLATPEGQNIGLVLHFASYARVDKYGFITTPFRKLGHSVANDGISSVHRVTREALLDAKGEMIIDEKMLITAEIAQEIKSRYPHEDDWSTSVSYWGGWIFWCIWGKALSSLRKQMLLTDELMATLLETRVAARRHFEATTEHLTPSHAYWYISKANILWIIFSYSISRTWWCDSCGNGDEHDASGGSSYSWLRHRVVGTGMERQISVRLLDMWSRQSIMARLSGVDGKHITVIYDNGQKKSLMNSSLLSDQTTICSFNQKPLVSAGQIEIEPGDILVDGQSIEDGELALGRNLDGCIYAVGRVQLRGLNHPFLSYHAGGLLHESVHITEYIDGCPWDQARPWADHLRYPKCESAIKAPKSRWKRNCASR